MRDLIFFVAETEEIGTAIVVVVEYTFCENVRKLMHRKNADIFFNEYQ